MANLFLMLYIKKAVGLATQLEVWQSILGGHFGKQRDENAPGDLRRILVFGEKVDLECVLHVGAHGW